MRMCGHNDRYHHFPLCNACHHHKHQWLAGSGGWQKVFSFSFDDLALIVCLAKMCVVRMCVVRMCVAKMCVARG